MVYIYSSVRNRRGGGNKRGGLEKSLKVIKRGGCNKRGGGVEKAPRWMSMGWGVINECGEEKTNICIG